MGGREGRRERGKERAREGGKGETEGKWSNRVKEGQSSEGYKEGIYRCAGLCIKENGILELT